MAKLADALDRLTMDGDSLVLDAPESWSQGRTLYGGMTAALCYEAAMRHAGVDAPLRSAQFTFAGPATGKLMLRAEVLRQGRTATIVAADCTTDAGSAARASFVFAADRDSRVAQSAPTHPPLPSPDDCPLFIEGSGGFHQNFDMRLAAGSALFSGGAPDFTVWVRFRDSQEVDPAIALLALADALPPAAMAAFPEPAPISTMTWNVDVARVPDAVDGWNLLRSTSEHSLRGYSMQAMSLWHESGELIASGRQTVAIFI
jgi:acyl-CoA thioesterase